MLLASKLTFVEKPKWKGGRFFATFNLPSVTSNTFLCVSAEMADYGTAPGPVGLEWMTEHILPLKPEGGGGRESES